MSAVVPVASQSVPGDRVRPHDLLQVGGRWRRVVSTPPASPLTRTRIPDARTAVCVGSWTLTLDPREAYPVVRGSRLTGR